MSTDIKWFPPSWFQIKSNDRVIYIDPAYLRSYYKKHPKKIEFFQPFSDASLEEYLPILNRVWQMFLENHIPGCLPMWHLSFSQLWAPLYSINELFYELNSNCILDSNQSCYPNSCEVFDGFNWFTCSISDLSLKIIKNNQIQFFKVICFFCFSTYFESIGLFCGCFLFGQWR